MDRTEILRRLERSVDAWNSDVTHAQERLSRQISEARQQLLTLLDVLGAGNGHAAEAIAKNGEVEQLKNTVAEKEEALDASEQKAVQLSQTILTLKAELAGMETSGGSARADNAKVLERIDALRQEQREFLDKIRDEIAGAKAESSDSPSTERAGVQGDVAEVISGLKDEITSLRSDVAALTDARTGDADAGVSESIQAIHGEIAELKALIGQESAASAKLDASEAEIERLQSELSRLEEERDTFRQALEAPASGTPTEAESETRVAQLHKTMAALEEELADTKEREAEYRAELDRARATSANREGGNEAVAAGDAAAEREALSAEIEEFRAQARKHEEALKQSEVELARVRDQLTQREAAAQEQAAQLNSVIAELTNDLDALREASSEGSEQPETPDGDVQGGLNRDRSSHDVTRLGDDLSSPELQSRYDQAIGELNEARKEVEQLREELRAHEVAAKEQEERLGAVISELNDDLTEHQTEKPEVEEKEESLTEEVGALREENTRRSQALEDAQKETERLQQALDAEEHRRTELESRMRESVASLNSQIAEKDSKEAELEQVRAELAELEKALADKNAEAEQARDEVAQLQAKLDELAKEEDRSDLERQLGEARQRVEESEAEIARLEEKVDTLMRANATIRVSPEGSTEDANTRIQLAGFDAHNRRRALGEILVNAGIITEQQLERAIEEQRINSQRRLGTILVEMGFTTEEVIARTLASQLKLPFMRLPEEALEQAAVQTIDGAMATHHMCIPVKASDSGLTVAMANPLDSLAIDEVREATGKDVEPVVATMADISAAIVLHYGVN